MSNQTDKTKASILNMLLTGVYQVVMIVFGLLIPRLILDTYGPVLHGYTSTVSTIMSYVALINAGLASASVQALYAPLAKKDTRRLNEVLGAIGHFYTVSGWLYTLAVLVIAAILPFFLSGQLETAQIVLLMIAIGASSTLECFIYSKYRVLLQADQHLFVVSAVDMAVYFVRIAAQLILIWLGFDIIWVMAVPIGIVVLRVWMLSAYCKRNYPGLDRTVKADKSALSKRWSAMAHQIAGLVVFNTDIMLLTFFGKLVQVSIYSVYNMVFTHLYHLLTNTFSTGIMASFGQLMHEDDHKTLLEAFDLYEYGYYAVVSFIYGVTASMILPFVSVYTRKHADIPYVDTKLAVLFVLIAFLNTMRTPSGTMISAAGHFKETKWRAILEAVINLTVSLLLMKPLGMYGILIGTCCSFAYRTTDIIYYSHKHILHISCAKTALRVLRTGSLILASAGIYYYIFGLHLPDNWGQLLLHAVIASLLTGILTVSIFFLTERNQFVKCVRILCYCSLRSSNR